MPRAGLVEIAAEAILEFLHADRLVEGPSDAAKLHVLRGLKPVEHLAQEGEARTEFEEKLDDVVNQPPLQLAFGGIGGQR